MDKRWLELLFGQVQIEVMGDRAEQFINRCLEHEISISNIRRTGRTTIICTVQSEDVRRMRPLLRQSDCKLHIVRRKGLPFFLRKMTFKKGFVAGLVLFTVLLFVLSNMLWRVDIKGADPQTAHQIRQVLDNIGVERGKFQFQLPSRDDIQYAISDQVDKVAWVGVGINGTTYTLDVVKKEMPEEKKGLTPRNLVASKEAVVRHIYVEQGKARVKADDYVKKGDVLISGRIGEKDHQKVVPAKGKVTGETWYESRVSIPLKTKLKTYTGQNYKKQAIYLFGLRVPLWGFSGPDFNHYDVKTKKTSLKFLGWTLPFSYETKKYLATEQVNRSYSEKQAVKKAKTLTKKDLQKTLDDNDKIKSEKILREAVENGKVKILMYYTVIEDIAVEKPLIESEKGKETE